MIYGVLFALNVELNWRSKGVGAHPWILERRSGVARGIYNRLQADRYYAGSQILTEAQWSLNTSVSASGYSAFQLVFGSNPMDLYGWDDSDDDLGPVCATVATSLSCALKRKAIRAGGARPLSRTSMDLGLR